MIRFGIERHLQQSSNWTSAIKRISICCFAAYSLGCSPSLPDRINVPAVPIDTKMKSGTKNESMIFVDQFADARQNQTFVTFGDKAISHIEDLSPSVVNGMKNALRSQGFVLSDTAPIIISGKIRNWSAQVTSGMPSKVDAESEIFVELLDPANKRMYSGAYKGYAAVESPSIDEGDVKTALGASMREAITQATTDPNILRLLSSY